MTEDRSPRHLSAVPESAVPESAVPEPGTGPEFGVDWCLPPANSELARMLAALDEALDGLTGVELRRGAMSTRVGPDGRIHLTRLKLLDGTGDADVEGDSDTDADAEGDGTGKGLG